MRVRSTMADSDCLDDHDLGENRVIVRKIAKRRHCCCQAAREKAKVLPNMVLAINMVEKCWKMNSIGRPGCSSTWVRDVGT